MVREWRENMRKGKVIRGALRAIAALQIAPYFVRVDRLGRVFVIGQDRDGNSVVREGIGNPQGVLACDLLAQFGPAVYAVKYMAPDAVRRWRARNRP